MKGTSKLFINAVSQAYLRYAGGIEMKNITTKNEKSFSKKTKDMNAQELFVHQHKKHHKTVALSRFFILIAFLVIWEVSADFGWIDSFFFSSPSRVVLCFISMLEGYSIFTHIGVTLFETLLSFMFIVMIGLAVATLLWSCKKTAEIAEPFLVVLNSLPKSALAPLIIVWLGTGLKTIIIAGISVAIFGSIISLYTGFTQIDKDDLKLIQTLGGSKWNSFFKVVLPGSVPTILSTMKVNIGLALVGVIIGEFLAARQGLGYLIIYGSQVFQLNMLIMSILILCIIAMGLYQILHILEHNYLKKF